MLRWLRTVVVSDEEKAHVMRQVGTRKASGSEPSDEASKQLVDIETGEYKSLRDEPGGCLLTGQAVSGVKAARAWSAALAWNVGRPVSRLMAAYVVGIERERAGRRKPKGVEYRCGAGWRTGS
jgi:hypothetical protein